MWDALRGIHVACLLFVCFTQGAWSCLNQNIDVKARHSFSARGGLDVCWCGMGTSWNLMMCERVYFEPYVGSLYGKKASRIGRRVLVVGASHYCGNYEEGIGCNAGCPHYGCNVYTEKRRDITLSLGAHCEDFTKVVVRRYCEQIGDSGERRWFATFTRFLNAFFVNGVSTHEQRVALYRELAHTEYVRGAEGNVAMVPNPVLFNDAVNFKDLVATMKDLRPEVVLLWGVRVWNRVIKDLGNPPVEGDVAEVVLGNRKLHLVRVPHPSSRHYNAERLRSALRQVGITILDGQTKM